jgi:hypothetical protein
VELLLVGLRHAVERHVDGWLDIGGVERQQLLLQRARALPILEAHEPGARVGELVALVVAEDDRPRRDLGRRDGGHRGDLLQPELLRRGGARRSERQDGKEGGDGSHLQ